ncbi:MAG: alanine racemase [Erysipelotrichaceae bacterium]
MDNRRCYIEISKDNLRKNVAVLKQYISDKTAIIAVVKDNFYGHGAVELTKVLIECGINKFAVSCYQEAMELRAVYSDIEIVILGYVPAQYYKQLAVNNIAINISSVEMAKKLAAICEKEQFISLVEVAVDTGMSRNGISLDTSDEDLRFIYHNPYLLVRATYSHLATSDSFLQKDQQNTLKQKENFDYVCNRLDKMGLYCGQKHLCASAGVINYPQFNYDAVRVGFMLLGFDVGEVNNRYQRYPLLSWYGAIMRISEIKKGQIISYGGTYICNQDKKIATISVGYGDGYPRRLSNKGYVLINGERCNIVGRICMDQMMVDVSQLDHIDINDKVVLVGSSKDKTITLNELANLSDTIVDELVCNINHRVEREYI